VGNQILYRLRDTKLEKDRKIVLTQFDYPFEIKNRLFFFALTAQIFGK
jgi:hypothetical protein